MVVESNACLHIVTSEVLPRITSLPTRCRVRNAHCSWTWFARHRARCIGVAYAGARHERFRAATVLVMRVRKPNALDVVLDYCAAVRGIINDSQGGPLRPPGLRMSHAPLARRILKRCPCAPSAEPGREELPKTDQDEDHRPGRSR